MKKLINPIDKFSAPGNKPIQVTEDSPQECSKYRLLRRKLFLESTIRCTFGFLCGYFLFSHPVIIFLLLLFIAYMYVVKM